MYALYIFMEIIKALILILSIEYDVPPNLALAIAYAEHWNGSIETTVIKEDAVNVNVNGTCDYGVMQLNSRYFNIDWTCTESNIKTGVQHIRWLMNRCNTYYQVALAYNCGLTASKTNPPLSSIRYASRVMDIYLSFENQL